MKLDSLYYYRGGTDQGSWHRVACTPAEFAAKEEELRRAGYVTRRGSSMIGPPEGPPVELFSKVMIMTGVAPIPPAGPGMAADIEELRRRGITSLVLSDAALRVKS